MAEASPEVSGKVFISYRREETAYPAGWLFDRLAEEFGADHVFKDVDSISPGDDFVEKIAVAVGSTDVLLALIGDEWLTITDEHGNRRLDNSDDFVRIEIEAALERKVRVIPILVGDAKIPRADQLPPSLAALARRHALELSPNRFEFDTSRLLTVLRETFAAARQAQRAAVIQENAAEGPRAPAPPADAAGPTRPRVTRRRLLAGSGVLLAAVAGIVLAVALGSSAGPDDAAGGAKVGRTTKETTTNAVAEPLTLAWKQSLTEARAGHQEVTAIAPTGPRSGVAVGFETVADAARASGTNRPLAWRYRRGRWAPERLPTPQPYAELQAVAFSPAGSTTVAAGASGLGHAHSAAAVWTKAGNGAWQPVCLSDCSSPPGHAEIFGVVALPTGGFVAVGQGAAGSPTEFHPTVWTSADGLVWVTNVLDESKTGTVRAIARAADGRLIAVGRTGPEQATSAAVWSSDNGMDWHAADVSALAAARELHAVSARGATLLAVGFRKATATTPCGTRRQTAIYRSADAGQRWHPVRTSALANAEQWKDVLTYRDQFVALGYDFVGCEKQSIAAAWISPAGTKWTKLTGPFLESRAESVLGGGAVIGRTLFAGGDGPSKAKQTGAFDERDARIWAGQAQ